MNSNTFSCSSVFLIQLTLAEQMNITMQNIQANQEKSQLIVYLRNATTVFQHNEPNAVVEAAGHLLRLSEDCDKESAGQQ